MHFSSVNNPSCASSPERGVVVTGAVLIVISGDVTMTA